jgi:hypothetical protein
MGVKLQNRHFAGCKILIVSRSPFDPIPSELGKGLQWIEAIAHKLFVLLETLLLYLFGREQILLTAGAASANHVSPFHA